MRRLTFAFAMFAALCASLAAWGARADDTPAGSAGLSRPAATLDAPPSPVGDGIASDRPSGSLKNESLLGFILYLMGRDETPAEQGWQAPQTEAHAAVPPPAPGTEAAKAKAPLETQAVQTAAGSATEEASLPRVAQGGSPARIEPAVSQVGVLSGAEWTGVQAAAHVTEVTAPGKAAPDIGAAPKGEPLLAQNSGGEELSYQALAAATTPGDRFWFVSAGAMVPIVDHTFKEFVDYGGMITIGARKRLTEKLSISATVGFGLMTGEWSTGGDRQSIIAAAEEYYPGLNAETDVVITPEDVAGPNLGSSYHSGAEAVVTSSESLKHIDVDTDLYLFPVALNAIYQISQTPRFSAYVQGGLGFCTAVRDCNSRAVKDKYFSGPEYRVELNKSQSVTGMLMNLGAGMSMPVYERLTFVAEASTTFYDLDSFDPVMQISFAKQNQDPDLQTYTYEKPLRIGVFKEVYITNIQVGFVVPF